jgi:hypothetical protein
MSDSEEVIVINEGLEQRTSGSGKTRFTLKITAEPVVADFDVKELGRGPALAIAELLRRKVSHITAAAAPATLRARKVAARAVKAGKTWAMKRYSGGRMGTLEPNQSMALFNDSERFEKSIVANASSDGAWRVNVAANRLESSTTRPGGVATIYQRLVELVPELGNPALLLEEFSVRRAVEDSARQLVVKAQATNGALQRELAKALLEVFRSAADLAA